MLGVMKDKRQLLKENTHSSKDMEEQTTCSLKHNWKVASPLHSTCFPKLGVAWETAALLTFYLLSVLGQMQGFSHFREGQKKSPQNLGPEYFTSFFFTVLEKATSTFSPSLVTSWMKDRFYTWDRFWKGLCDLSVSPFGRHWKLVTWYIPNIPLDRRK